VEELTGIAVRATVMYVYAVVLMRISGKRAMRQFSMPDAAAIFLIGDMFDDIFWAELPLAKGLVGVSTVVLIHLLAEWGIWRWLWFDRLVESAPRLMLRNGEMLPEALAAERLRREDLTWELRTKGEDDLDEIEEAYQEPADHLSVVRKEEHRPAQKRDLPRFEALFR
jgi:uncharacterized membrane protein YcaP (DUF421 family)